jgi:acyl-coenzyme A synthetase/AMP-(fatty) acid ligase
MRSKLTNSDRFSGRTCSWLLLLPLILVAGCAGSSDAEERGRLRDEIRERVCLITGINCVIELVPPRTLPRTSSGKLSRAKARNLYLSGQIQPYDIAA